MHHSYSRFGMTILVLLSATYVFGAETKVTAEDILKHHLDSIADPATRASMKSRVIEGAAAYRILVGGAGESTGKAVIVSDHEKMHMLLKVAAQQYNGEQFIRDGDRTSVAGTYADKTRSEFGRFLWSENLPLREGLLGGVLTTGWSLLDLGKHRSKLHYDGIKNVGGMELHAVTYQPKKSSDLEITLYFEPETFHHVLTVYTASVHAGIGLSSGDIMAPPSEIGTLPKSGSGDVNAARQQQTRYRIEERFSDFKTADGLTLPTHYNLRFQEELRNGFTKLVEWDVATSRMLSNIPVDERNFQVR